MKIAKILLSILLITALLAGCAPADKQSGTTQTPTTTATQPQQTQPDGNNIPTTQPPATEPPATEPPATEPPATEPPATEPPVTEPPATEPDNIQDLDFTVYDADGKEVKLSDFIGKPIILNFWASWCFPCITELPHFNAKCQEYGEQIHFLLVNVTAADTMEDAKALLEQRGFVFPVYYDVDGNAMQTYQVSSIPVTYLIDSEGNIIDEIVGSMNKKELQKLIDKLLAAGQ